jgi:putative ABC transport system permease protein
MELLEFVQVAWESITTNKLRSALTMLGIIIGVASVIVMVSISAGTSAAIENQITGLGSNLIYVGRSFTPGGARFGGNQGDGLVFDDADAIEQNVGGVTAVTVEQATSATVKAGTTTLDDVTILGSTADYPDLRGIEMGEGRYFHQDGVEAKAKIAVLGSDVAEQLFGGQSPIGQTIFVGTTRLIVIGVFEPRGQVSGVDFDGQVYVPITVVFQNLLPNQFARFLGNNVRMIYVQVGDRSQMDTVIEQITRLLAKRHDVSVDSPDFSVTTQQDIIDAQESTTSAFRNLLAWVAGVSLIVGGIGIMNIMLVSVTERTREIGIRQSVGATPNDIRYQFLTEATLLSFLGGLLGCLVGLAGAWMFGRISDLPIAVVPTSIVLAFASAAIVGVFFGFYPANQAAQLDPIEALRHE